jgi:hypothetical protein
MRHAPHASMFATLVLAALAASCRYGDCDDCGSDFDPTIYESEPNDQACCANFLGTLAPYDNLTIRGSMSGFSPDFFDGFALQAAQPMDVRVELVSDDPFADFDVCIYDPLIDDFVACFETGAHPEVGLFSVLDSGREFHVVVTPFSGVGGYTLYVDAFPISLAALGAENEGIRLAQPKAEARERAHSLGDYHPDAATPEEPVTRLEPPILGRIIEVDEDGEVHTRPVLIRRVGDSALAD